MENCQIEEPIRFEDLQEEHISQEPPKNWDEHLIAAEDELRDARRLNRDNPEHELSLRMEAVDRAKMAIDEARKILTANAEQLKRAMRREVAGCPF